MTLDNILGEIKKANSIVILAHENPDGDAIGCCMGMRLALQQLGKNVDVIIPEYPKCFKFLPGIKETKKDSEIENYDLAIALDCATTKLLSTWNKYFESAKTKIVIDHHASNSMYGDLNYVDPKSPACAQTLAIILSYFNIEITKDIATCLLTGIITDTGGFAYSGVNADTFEIAAKLVEQGINVYSIYQKVFLNMSQSKFNLHKIATDRLELFEKGKISYTYITKNDEKQVNAETGDYEGIVEIGRNIDGVEVSIFLRETEKGIKVSLRSKDYLNASEICAAFGGGGHTRAAGCTMVGTIDQVKMQVINKIKESLKN